MKCKKGDLVALVCRCRKECICSSAVGILLEKVVRRTFPYSDGRWNIYWLDLDLYAEISQDNVKRVSIKKVKNEKQN